MTMTIDELKKLRIWLGITQEEVGKRLSYDVTTIGDYELKQRKISKVTLSAYEDFLTKCAKGEIEYKKSVHHRLGNNTRTPENLCCSKEQVIFMRRIRESLGISLNSACKAIGKKITALTNKECGKVPMLITEFEALMKYYKQEKLKRIFGRNYKEEK